MYIPNLFVDLIDLKSILKCIHELQSPASQLFETRQS